MEEGGSVYELGNLCEAALGGKDGWVMRGEVIGFIRLLSKSTLGEEIGELTAEALSVCWSRRARLGALEVARDMSRTSSGRTCLPSLCV
jgi:hypothetical protein